MSETTHDQVSAAGSEIFREEYFRTPETETGWDRVKMMYTKKSDVIGLAESNSEFRFITECATSAFFTGGILGCVLTYRHAQEEFIRKNKATTYSSMYDAKRKFYDKVILDMMRSGWRWGWRLSLLCGTYASIVTTIAVYRNKVAIREHVLAGTVIGTVWKFNLGLRASLVGGIVGGSLGTIAGSAISGLFWITGISLADMRYWSHGYWQKQLKQREEELNKIKQEKNQEKKVPALDWHDQRIEKDTSNAT